MIFLWEYCPTLLTNYRKNSNEAHFSVLTSGFTAVTNTFVIDTLLQTKKLLDEGEIQMVNYEDFFEVGYKLKTDKDVYQFLTNGGSRGCTKVKRTLPQSGKGFGDYLQDKKQGKTPGDYQ
jgi:glucosamine-6-phosphate deaminase